MLDDPLISLAVSIRSNTGVYALLLGSGLSRAAGIPTGWEIVKDLIAQIATARGESCDPDPMTRYRNTYRAEADYSKLLEELAATPDERNRLLRSYFEPTEDERKSGIKLPTKAHRVIATLVSKGLVRVIVTTNFDRLLEQAIHDEGVVPTVG